MPEFVRQAKILAKRYKSFKSDLINLQASLLSSPELGIDLGNGVRKVRMAIASKNRGKSHGARVITFTYIINEENGVIDLIYIYDKSDTDNINSEFISTLVSEARDIAESDSK